MAQAIRHSHDNGHGERNCGGVGMGGNTYVERLSCWACTQMKKLSLLPFYVLGAMLGLSLVLIAISLFQTFFPLSPPVTVKSSEYRAVKTSDGTIVISYDCESVIHEDFEAHVHRTAEHVKTGLIISLPTSETKYHEGERKVQRQFYIPSPAPAGEYCITSQMEWRPMFSLTDRAAPKRVQCIEVR